MDPEFWRRKWEAGEIGFHAAAPNALLMRHFSALGLAPGARAFLPLCGKTLDIHWLLGQGVEVVGAELSARAVDQLFEELGVVPDLRAEGPLRRLSAPGIVIHQGDVFDLDAATLGPVAAVYDRAALVALPADLRTRYAAHVADLTGGAPQLLLAFDYDQGAMTGPPFSVSEAELRRLYEGRYALACLERRRVEGGLRDGVPVEESAWRMTPRR